MKTKEVSRLSWYNQKSSAVLLAGVSFMLAFALGLRAIDTGSLQQYGIAFVLIIVAFNRIIRVTPLRKHL